LRAVRWMLADPTPKRARGGRMAARLTRAWRCPFLPQPRRLCATTADGLAMPSRSDLPGRRRCVVSAEPTPGLEPGPLHYGRDAGVSRKLAVRARGGRGPDRCGGRRGRPGIESRRYEGGGDRRERRPGSAAL
jgi:hypothetical protein